MDGYIKLWRVLIEKPIWLRSTPEQKAILITLMCLANHQENEWEWKGEKFKVLPGEFVTSIESIRKNTGLGISAQNVRSSLNRFKKLEFLTNRSTKMGRVITICNWKQYQPSQGGDQQSTQQTGNKEATETQHLTRMEEGKNGKKRDKDTCPYEEILILYHSILDGLPLIAKLSSGLKKKIKARWVSDADRRNIDWWRWYFEGVAKCDFLMGRIKDWSANFHWLIGPENMDKVLSGYYTNRNKTESAIEDWINE